MKMIKRILMATITTSLFLVMPIQSNAKGDPRFDTKVGKSARMVARNNHNTKVLNLNSSINRGVSSLEHRGTSALGNTIRNIKY